VLARTRTRRRPQAVAPLTGSAPPGAQRSRLWTPRRAFRPRGGVRIEACDRPEMAERDPRRDKRRLPLSRTTRRVIGWPGWRSGFCSRPTTKRSSSTDLALLGDGAAATRAGLGPRGALGFTRLRWTGSLAALPPGVFVPMHTMRSANRVALLVVVLSRRVFAAGWPATTTRLRKRAGPVLRGADTFSAP